MTRLAALIVSLALANFAASIAAAAPAEISDVCFTPGGDCTDIVVREIDSARRQVLVQAYSFTSAPIAEALVKAKRRGVDVRAVLDKSQQTERYSGATFLANGGVSVLIDSAHAIAHNKVMVIDGITVITGSFNFTKAAQERNAENLLVIRDATIAAKYTRNWEEHAGHSEPFRCPAIKARCPAMALPCPPSRVDQIPAAVLAPNLDHTGRVCQPARGNHPARLPSPIFTAASDLTFE